MTTKTPSCVHPLARPLQRRLALAHIVLLQTVWIWLARWRQIYIVTSGDSGPQRAHSRGKQRARADGLQPSRLASLRYIYNVSLPTHVCWQWRSPLRRSRPELALDEGDNGAISVSAAAAASQSASQFASLPFVCVRTARLKPRTLPHAHIAQEAAERPPRCWTTSSVLDEATPRAHSSNCIRLARIAAQYDAHKQIKIGPQTGRARNRPAV